MLLVPLCGPVGSTIVAVMQGFSSESQNPCGWSGRNDYRVATRFVLTRASPKRKYSLQTMGVGFFGHGAPGFVFSGDETS